MVRHKKDKKADASQSPAPTPSSVRRIRERITSHAHAARSAFARGFHEVQTTLRSVPTLLVAQWHRFAKHMQRVWQSAVMLRIRHVAWATTLIGSTVVVVCVALFGFYSASFADRILVKVRAAGADISGLTYEGAVARLRAHFETFESIDIPFVVDGATVTIPGRAFGISYDFEETARRAYAIGHTGNFWEDQRARLKAIFVTQQVIDPVELITDDGIEAGIRAHIPAIREKAHDASVEVVNNSFVVSPAQSGTTTDFAIVAQHVRDALETFEPQPIEIAVIEELPVITDEEAAGAIVRADDMSREPLQLVYNDHGNERLWELDLVRDKSWIAFRADGPLLHPTLREAKVRELLDTEIAPAINRQRIDATITMPTDGGKFATIAGNAADGYSLLIEDSIAHAKQQFESRQYTADLAVVYEPGRILTPDGTDVGLHDLLATGWSNFSNSEAGRHYNVGFGLSKYNGLLIAPGETFSFKDWLGGPVEYSTGWKPALAIFDGGASTEKVAGGGLCQVSTTVYRAALRAGLPIVERKAHSFYVNHYTEGGDGLDATVYPPSPDLKFLNDTGHYILVQTYTEGDNAYVKLYGTHDGRTVTLDGPHHSPWASPGAARVIETTALAPGQERQKSPLRYGRTITWYQTVTYPDGTTAEDTIVSKYAAVPAYIERGVTTVTQTNVPPPASNEIIL